MKKILIVGRSNNTLIDSITSKLKEDFGNNLSFDLLSLTKVDDIKNDLYDNVFDESFITLTANRVLSIPKITGFIYKKKLKNNFKKICVNYDYIHFHFIFSILNLFEKPLIHFKGKIIATLWGSDFYRRDKKERLKMYKFYNQVDLFTFANPKMRQDFFNFYKKLEKNFLEVRFGLSLLDELNDQSPSSIDKTEFNIPSDKLSIYIGTNGAKGQQHLEIIDKLKDLSINIKRKIFLVLPLNYGLDTAYEKKIINSLANIDIAYTIVKDYFDEEILTRFRKACDILLQLQTTDALSAAMQEHLFFSSLVITGSWLPYEIFDNKSIYYHKIDKIDELASKLELIITNFDKEKENCKANPDYIKEISSWDSNLKKWYKCYTL